MTTELGTGSGQGGQGEEISDIPVIENPNELRGQYILIDVFDLTRGSSRKRDVIENLRNSFRNLAERVGSRREFEEIPDRGFMVSILGGTGFRDLTGFYNRSEKLLADLESGVSREIVRNMAEQLFIFYPRFLPPEPEPLDEETEYEIGTDFDAMKDILGADRDPGIHVRIPEDMYMYFLKSVYSIVENRELDVDRIRIHAMKE